MNPISATPLTVNAEPTVTFEPVVRFPVIVAVLPAEKVPELVMLPVLVIPFKLDVELTLIVPVTSKVEEGIDEPPILVLFVLIVVPEPEPNMIYPGVAVVEDNRFNVAPAALPPHNVGVITPPVTVWVPPTLAVPAVTKDPPVTTPVAVIAPVAVMAPLFVRLPLFVKPFSVEVETTDKVLAVD
jgi:hypothetical protein